MDRFMQIPSYLLSEILSYLKLSELMTFARINKHYYHFVKNNDNLFLKFIRKICPNYVYWKSGYEELFAIIKAKKLDDKQLLAGGLDGFIASENITWEDRSDIFPVGLNFPKLLFLKLDSNMLKSLPAIKMPNLQILNISNNFLKSFPENIHLPNLIELRITRCCLTIFPAA